MMKNIGSYLELEMKIGLFETNWNRCKNDFGFIKNSYFKDIFKNIEFTMMLKEAKEEAKEVPSYIVP